MMWHALRWHGGAGAASAHQDSRAHELAEADDGLTRSETRIRFLSSAGAPEREKCGLELVLVDLIQILGLKSNKKVCMLQGEDSMPGGPSVLDSTSK